MHHKSIHDDQQIDTNSMFLTYAPGESKRPIFNEPFTEYLCSIQYFVDKNAQQMKKEHIHCISEIFLNMNCILLTPVLHQIFQIYFGKQNISKQSRLQIQCH